MQCKGDLEWLLGDVFVAHISKPINRDDLLRTIKIHCKGNMDEENNVTVPGMAYLREDYDKHKIIE